MAFALYIDGHLRRSEPSEPRLPWWSFTKTVLSAAALSLVDDRRMGLDELVPEGPFTLRQLLGHEAGLADYGELTDYHAAVARGDDAWPAEEMLQRVYATQLRYPPGEGRRYSNVGYLYICRLIERASGLPLAHALDQRVLKPLGLTDVALVRERTDLPGMTGYDTAWVYHGLLVGPIGQAALLLDRLLSGHLLSEGMLAQMRCARILGGPIAGTPWQVPGYGLGLMQGEVAGGLLLAGHTGSGPGSSVAVYGATHGGRRATCAVFHRGGQAAATEAEAEGHLSESLGLPPRSH